MKYDKEFKEKALKLSDEIGVKAADNQLGIKYYTLADCICYMDFLSWKRDLNSIYMR